jgi:hypothetical protein
MVFSRRVSDSFAHLLPESSRRPLLARITSEFTIHSSPEALTNRSSAPLAGVMTTFDFMKPFLEFATLAPASGALSFVSLGVATRIV